MPNEEVIRTRAVATAPEFYAHVARAFAFLTSTYGYRLATQDITAIDDVRDTQVVVKYISAHLEVDVIWGVVSVSVSVQFATLPPLAHGASIEDVVRPKLSQIRLEHLAAVRGHANDPDFIQGDLDHVNGRIINKRFQFIQAHLTAIINGLARATERYGSEILRGDTSIFPQPGHTICSAWRLSIRSASGRTPSGLTLALPHMGSEVRRSPHHDGSLVAAHITCTARPHTNEPRSDATCPTFLVTKRPRYRQMDSPSDYP
jgi:hypothetical protein